MRWGLGLIWLYLTVYCSPRESNELIEDPDAIQNLQFSTLEPKSRFPNSRLRFDSNSPGACSGSKNSYSKSGMRPEISHYEYLQKMYQNCTHVYNNVEIVNYDEDRPIDFLDDIVQVKGYILIYNNQNMSSISMKKLQIIWGDSLHRNEYAIEIIHNAKLQLIQLPSLRAVMQGSVAIAENPRSCYANNTNWGEVLDPVLQPDGTSRIQIKNNGQACPKGRRFVCDPTCESGCFGRGAENCQQMVRSKCTPACKKDANACYPEVDPVTNVTNYECCDSECAGGCRGPTPSDCYSCKHYQDEETRRCVEFCSPLYRLNPATKTRYRDPNGKYTHDRSCVAKCPEGTLIEGAYCVLRCSEGYFYDARENTKECQPCKGLCPKSCRLEEIIDAYNIEGLQNCTEIDGFIRLRTHTFKSHKGTNSTTVPALRPEKLNYLKTVRQITQFVDIAGVDLRNLSFLENVEVIEGRELSDKKFAVIVSNNPHVESFNWRKLDEIRRGDVVVSQNHFLCYLSNTTFRGITAASVAVKGVYDRCANKCDDNCDAEFGCWGKGPTQCRKCKNWDQEGRCVKKCSENGFRAVEKTDKQGNLKRVCEKCAPQCLQCSGPGEEDCRSCRNVGLVKDNRLRCLQECPIEYFRSGNRCLPCHASCYDNGCTGPVDMMGDHGCNNCSIYVETELHGIRCLYVDRSQNHDSEACQVNNYTGFFAAPEGSRIHCKRCAPECKTCTTGGTSVKESKCQCRNMSIPSLSNPMDYECVKDCGSQGYPLNNTHCARCHVFCEGGCNGPSNLECNKCKNATITYGNGTVACLAECDDAHPYYDSHSKLCHTREHIAWLNVRKFLIVASILLMIAMILIVAWKCRYYKNKYAVEKIQNGPDLPEEIPFDPTIRPNMNKFHVIGIDELTRQGRVLGEGAFGVVYAGYYKQYNRKFPVAIKVIKKAQGNAQIEETMDEATKMAALSHPHLTRLLGICFADNSVQLVTWLRPLGSLLTFLTKHRMNLTGKNLLIYCYQISSAMKYLYEQRIVHRDLAARNVLVKSIDYVEVTDFGLSKLLEIGDSSIHVKSGKVPVKWMAPESLMKTVYTSASDVWSFGITCWEILTYGQSPYQGMDHMAIMDFLTVKGQRLEQPNNCSVDLYSVLLRCWVTDPNSRPTFITLKEDFHRFCRAPHLFVADANAAKKMLPQSQSEMLREVLETPDIDFQDPLEYDEHVAGSIVSGSRVSRLTSTNSQRYRGDPMDMFHDDPPSTPTTPRPNELEVEDSNYLVPNARAAPTGGGGVIYTTVVRDTGETDLVERPDNIYYNDVIQGPDYYNVVGQKRALLTPSTDVEVEEDENSRPKEVESAV